MCLWVRVYSSSSSTGLFPNDFTTKAWSPLLDGDPPAQGVYHIPALQPSVSASTHTYTYIYRSIDSCSPLRRAARKLGGPVIAFYYSSHMKHCCSPCDHPPQVQVSVPTQTLLVLGMYGVAGAPGNQAWTAGLFSESHLTETHPDKSNCSGYSSRCMRRWEM